MPDEAVPGATQPYDIGWTVRIPLRDGVRLNAVAYRPRHARSGPCVVVITPYSTQRMHERGAFFASHGYAFVVVDSRGRGNSEGQFRPFIQEGPDGHDVIEWVAQQPWCNGRVGMWGGSYMGHAQWAALTGMSSHLATIVPTASVYPGLDFPMRGNISFPYVARWLTYVSARAAQERVFGDRQYWTRMYAEHFESGAPFSALERLAGDNGAIFAEWIAHPMQDEYWDAHAPSPADYAGADIPILTITGCYDDDQPGALTYYRNHMRFGTQAARTRHYLVIGPWDHSGAQAPQAGCGGLTFGPASVLDMNELHLDWYRWTMGAGPRPEFLRDRVAYYVMGSDEWRYARTLEEVTKREEAFYLDSNGSADDVFAAGSLHPHKQQYSAFDQYVYNPTDIARARFEMADPDSLVDQTRVLADAGRQLVYHSGRFEALTEISGVFRLTAWLAIDQPDTDFAISVYEITEEGRSILLSLDLRRARYRESLRAAELITTSEPLRYDFDGFTFVSRRLQRNSRLRLVIGPVSSISMQKNYNSGKLTAEESILDSRTVTVRLFHGPSLPSVLHVPFG